MSLYRVSGINRPKTVGSFLSNIWHGVKAVAASAPRNAFMALVRLNVHGFATNLLARDADPVQQAQVKDKWERKLGGSYSALKSAFVDGAKNKKIFGVAYVAGVPGTISGEPVTTTALLTAAAAIIATLGDLLKALPSAPTTPGEDQAVQDAINQAAAEQQQQDAEKPDYSKFLLLGGAGLAAYLLLKKK